jgi:hypothetical protein
MHKTVLHSMRLMHEKCHSVLLMMYGYHVIVQYVLLHAAVLPNPKSLATHSLLLLCDMQQYDTLSAIACGAICWDSGLTIHASDAS